MVQSRGRPTIGVGKSLKMTVLVDQAMVQALDRAMEEMRVTMAGVRIDRSTAVRHLLSKALAPYVRTSAAPVTLEADQTADHSYNVQDKSAPQTAPRKDHKRPTGSKRQTAAKGDAHGAAGV